MSLITTSGCLASDKGDMFVVANEVDSLSPEAERTPVENESIQQSEVLVRTIIAVAESNESTAANPVSQQQADQIRSIMAALPTDRTERGTTPKYVQVGNVTVRIAILVEQ